MKKSLGALLTGKRAFQADRFASVAALLDRVLPKAGSLARGNPPAVPRKRGENRAAQTRPLSGGSFIAGSFANRAGRRDYKLFVPSSYSGQAIPLVVMLHGCTQSADDFAAGTRMNVLAEEQRCFVVYPEQTAAANVSRCWNWFNASHQLRDEGEPSIIAGLTRQIMHEYAVDAQRVYVGGLSAGAAEAAILGALYPDVYAAIGLHSGLAFGAARNLPGAFSAMRNGASGTTGEGRARGPHGASRSVPTIVFHGDRDTTVHPSNGDWIVAQATTPSLQAQVEQHTAPGGRAYRRTRHLDAAGSTILEQWVLHGAGHAWSGGSSAGSYTDPLGPDASREMLRFFLSHVAAPAVSARR